MTDRVTRKVFRNGGSLAVRIPKGWIAADAEIDIIRNQNGDLLIRPLNREDRIGRLLEYLIEQPEITDEDFLLPASESGTDRFNSAQMFRD